MKKQTLTIENGAVPIPAVLWGEQKSRLLLEIPDVRFGRESMVLSLAAQAAEKAGMCALSFDLPESGGRAGKMDPSGSFQNGRSAVLAVWNWAKSFAGEISVFACGIGVCLTLQSLPDIAPRQMLFLSPVLSGADMREDTGRICPMNILRGGRDKLCTQTEAQALAAQWGGELTVLPSGGHDFHTYDELAFFCSWMERKILPESAEKNRKRGEIL